MKTSHCDATTFCNCPAEKCPRHPKNHDMGCNPCIQDNLKKGKMPACFFRAIHDDASEVTDYSIEGFVNYFNKYNDEYREKYKKKKN